MLPRKVHYLFSYFEKIGEKIGHPQKSCLTPPLNVSMYLSIFIATDQKSIAIYIKVIMNVIMLNIKTKTHIWKHPHEEKMKIQFGITNVLVDYVYPTQARPQVDLAKFI